MERFKALEKEMKMKAFSKEGLMHASKLDPAEKARRDMIDWVGTSIEEIARQVEATEAELESLTAGKKKKSGQDRVNELEELNERRSWHVGRMEIVQRMLENGSLSTEAVEGIQEDIKYFIESNAVSLLYRHLIPLI
jgi:CCR4-NOT transcription complex subunit 3